MTRDEFLQRIDKLKVWQMGGVRAPHKPLLLLLALGRLSAGEGRLGHYGDEIEGKLRKLLHDFGPPRKSHQPDQPYARLQRDGLWEVIGYEALPRREGAVPRRGDLRSSSGGFPAHVQALLQSDPDLVVEAAGRILDAHFPRSLHNDIRSAVGISDYPSLREGFGAQMVRERDRQRRPEFRLEVLREYGRRCAVCDFDVRLEDRVLGLEAAHIKWHAAGGPDEVVNGLALCVLHHKALDVGALGLASDTDGVRVLVSSEVSGGRAGTSQLVDYHGAPLRQPQSPKLAPGQEFVHWHQEQVFRGPARVP